MPKPASPFAKPVPLSELPTTLRLMYGTGAALGRAANITTAHACNLLAGRVVAPGKELLDALGLELCVVEKNKGAAIESEQATQAQEEATAARQAPTLEDLYGLLADTYKSLGGAEHFHTAERESWER